jgi:hypothetical protein
LPDFLKVQGLMYEKENLMHMSQKWEHKVLLKFQKNVIENWIQEI